ncbi:MAG: pyruvate, water dikinase regulatory protein [Bacillota bacterium]|nr:pyruvate, water dikinase regulatory protein [Bacillota bacterium]
MKNIFLVSDSLGETSASVVRATASQFEDVNFNPKTFSFIRNREAVEEVVLEAARSNALLIFTTVLPEVRDALVEYCEEYGVAWHDILTPVLEKFQTSFGIKPVRKPGTTYKLDDDYFARMAAIEFAVKYDDGKDLRGLKKADLVLLGISRTSKTPLSMYLSHKNVKVANVPLVPEIPVAEEIFAIDRHKLIGLTNSPDILNEIRTERLRAMGLQGDSEYASSARIMQELEYADQIYKQLGCPVINVANKAIEETANIVLEITGLNRRK